MSGDEVARRQLQEQLLDDVELPSDMDREAMFERTFASPPGAGSDLVPADGLFDPAPDTPDDEGPEGAESDVEDLFATDDEAEPTDLELGPTPEQDDPHSETPDPEQHDDGAQADDPTTDW